MNKSEASPLWNLGKGVPGGVGVGVGSAVQANAISKTSASDMEEGSPWR